MDEWKMQMRNVESPFDYDFHWRNPLKIAYVKLRKHNKKCFKGVVRNKMKQKTISIIKECLINI